VADWKDTYPQLFREVDAAKEKAKADFLAALSPPNPAVVPEDKFIGLVDAISTAQWRALLEHIGPVSGDGSVTIASTLSAAGVPQLDLRAAAGWEKVTVDPSVDGLARNPATVVWQVDSGTPPLPVAIWLKTSVPDTGWEKLWPTSGGGGGGFTRAFLFEAATDPPQELYGATPHETGPFTIGGRPNWYCYNAEPTTWPYITLPNYPKIDSWSLFWMDFPRSQGMPVIHVPLPELGVPLLSGVAEMWVLVSTPGVVGDFGSFSDLGIGVGTITSGNGVLLDTAFSYFARMRSQTANADPLVASTVKVRCEAGAYSHGHPDASSIQSVTSGELFGIRTIALRILPDHAEVFVGPLLEASPRHRSLRFVTR